MRAPSDLARRLRDETARVQAELRALPIARATLTGALPLRAHVEQLVAWRTLHRVLEEVLGSGEHPVVGSVAVPWVARTPLIDHDLAELAARGVAPTGIGARAGAGAAHVVETLAAVGAGALLGSCYVVECATLDARVASRHLRDHLGVTARFHDVHGDATRRHVDAFMQRLAAHAPRSAHDGIVMGALATMRAVHVMLDAVGAATGVAPPTSAAVRARGDGGVCPQDG